MTNETPDPVVRIGLIQHACPLGRDPSDTLSRTADMIRDAAGRGARIVATQELFCLPYFPQTEDDDRFRLAEPIPGPTSMRLCGLASELGIHIVASLFEKRAPGIYHNTAVLIAPGTAPGTPPGSSASAGSQIISTYRKMHIPHDPRFYEKYYFTPGDLDWQAGKTPFAVAGLLICWDQWFPEAARLTALQGAQILFYPTAIAWSADETESQHLEQFDAWLTVQRAHAITNGVFVASINRVGVEGELRFWGSSFVADPAGRNIAQADSSDEQILIADCDLSRIDEWRRAWPFLRDRRIDAYGDLTKRFVDE